MLILTPDQDFALAMGLLFAVPFVLRAVYCALVGLLDLDCVLSHASSQCEREAAFLLLHKYGVTL